MSTWTSAKKQMPPPAGDNAGRSGYVLTCSCPDGVASVDDDGYVYDFYDGYLVAAYYDFVKEDWTNDALTAGDTIRVSHWMPLPAENDAEWAQAADSIPGDPSKNPAMDGCSIYVLASLSGMGYGASLVSATVVMDTGLWISENKTHIDFEVARWRPQPDSDGI
jgi:hypothetical protein